MGYIPTEWQTGDIITAAKLNKAEEGIEAAYPYIVPVVYNTETSEYILQASFDDISAAVSAGRLVLAKTDTSETDSTMSFLYAIADVTSAALPYQVYFFNPDGTEAYWAANSTDNLVLQAE